MSFVKLDEGILMSTLWVDHDATRVFVTALLMARPKEITEPLDQYDVYKLEKTGFVVPPGKYGLINASGQGIVRMSGLAYEPGMEALARLGDEDAESRTADFGGRRLVRVSGGYIALNFQKYRDKDSTNALRQERYRERHALRNGVTVTPVTQAEAEAEAEETTDIAQTKKSEPKYDRDLMGFHGITDEDRKAWAEAYPACDVGAELRKMVEWCKANPKKAHKSNWRKFIVNWLSRSQDRGGSSTGRAPVSELDLVNQICPLKD